jgi:cell division protease FtsH
MYSEGEEEVFLGYSRQTNMSMSNETAQAIDKEIRQIVDAGYDRAKLLLTDHRDELETLALALLEYETLSGDEIKTIIDGGSIDRGRSAKPALPTAGSSIPKSRKPSSGIGGAAPAGA